MKQELTKKDIKQLLDLGELEFYFEDYDSAVRAMEEFDTESYKVDDIQSVRAKIDSSSLVVNVNLRYRTRSYFLIF